MFIISWRFYTGDMQIVDLLVRRIISNSSQVIIKFQMSIAQSIYIEPNRWDALAVVAVLGSTLFLMYLNSIYLIIFQWKSLRLT